MQEIQHTDVIETPDFMATTDEGNVRAHRDRNAWKTLWKQWLQPV
jgi:hypothetical protein